MTLQEFQEQSLELVLQYMVLVYHILKSKKESADVKQKLLATALSLLIYAQEELETMLNNSENSISQDE